MGRKWSEENAVMFIDFDPNTAVSSDVSSTAWLDMSGYHRFTAIAFRTVGTGNVNAAAIKASAAASGSSPTTVTSIGTTTPTGSLVAADPGSKITSNDCGILVLDVTADEVAAAISGGRYVTLALTQAAATDEFGVIYILSEPRYAQSGLTATGAAAS